MPLAANPQQMIDGARRARTETFKPLERRLDSAVKHSARIQLLDCAKHEFRPSPWILRVYQQIQKLAIRSSAPDNLLNKHQIAGVNEPGSFDRNLSELSSYLLQTPGLS